MNEIVISIYITKLHLIILLFVLIISPFVIMLNNYPQEQKDDTWTFTTTAQPKEPEIDLPINPNWWDKPIYF